MKDFLKNNPMLVFGLGLPLVMILLFAGAGVVMRLTVEPPRYDALYAIDYNTNNNVFIQVVNQKLSVSVSQDACYFSLPRVYQYSSAQHAIKEIPLTLPAALAQRNSNNCVHGKTGQMVSITPPELATMKLQNTTVAPDGYEFIANDYRAGSPMLVTGLFFGHGGRYATAVLKKNSYRLRVPDDVDYYRNAHFIGWVVP